MNPMFPFLYRPDFRSCHPIENAEDKTTKIIIFKGDDTDFLGNQKIRITIDTKLDISNCSAHFRFLNYEKEWDRIPEEKTLDIVFSAEQTGMFPLGIANATLWLVDNHNKKRTIANRIQIVVTQFIDKAYAGSTEQDITVIVSGEGSIDLSSYAKKTELAEETARAKSAEEANSQAASNAQAKADANAQAIEEESVEREKADAETLKSAKGYTDSAVGGIDLTPYAKKAADQTFTGENTFDGAVGLKTIIANEKTAHGDTIFDSVKIKKSDGTDGAMIDFGGINSGNGGIVRGLRNPQQIYDATSKYYVDQQISNLANTKASKTELEEGLEKKLDKTGGEITGELKIHEEISVYKDVGFVKFLFPLYYQYHNNVLATRQDLGYNCFENGVNVAEGETVNVYGNRYYNVKGSCVFDYYNGIDSCEYEQDSHFFARALIHIQSGVDLSKVFFTFNGTIVTNASSTAYSGSITAAQIGLTRTWKYVTARWFKNPEGEKFLYLEV